MWDNWDVGCLACGIFEIWYLQDVGCLGCWMFGMWGVRDGMFGI